MKVFIGSSGEQSDLVDWLTRFILKHYASQLEPDPWTAPWTSGSFTLENLLRKVKESDASILFWTPDDLTTYRGKSRFEPRDNMVLEAGLFIGVHGRERTHLMVPVQRDAALRVATPTDLLGVTWNQYEWPAKVSSIEATGLPATSREVCDSIVRLGPRRRIQSAVSQLSGRDTVEEITTFVGEWRTLQTDAILRLAAQPAAREIDLVAQYRVGEIRRVLSDFRKRPECRLRACFADLFDDQLLAVYQLKFYNRTAEQLRERLLDSVRELLGPGEIEIAKGDLAIGRLDDAPSASYGVRLTGQRVTYSYYRIDDVAFILPLDMKREQEPPPLGWVLERNRAPVAFEYYLRDFTSMFSEARVVYGV